VHTPRPRPDSAQPTGTFADLGLPAALVDVLHAAGIERPTPIQAQALPDALAGRDVLGRARTGSGKTLAFGLPLLTRLAATQRTSQPRAVVLLPTRELAQQVEGALRPLARAVRLRVSVVVGGQPISRQIAALRRGVDVLVATPGRLVDLLQRNAVTLDSVSIAVLDEADHMADLGFVPAVTRILDAMPGDRQCLLFSATLDRDVDRLVSKYLSDPAVHRADEGEMPAAAMDHRIFRVAGEQKVDVAAEIATREQRTLFFVRTKHGADRLARQFRSRGVDAAALHGNLNQNQRRRALDAFASGTSRVLVATDVAARGIHIDDLDLVVHFDPPADAKVYVHRSGRTARAGASGTVLSLVEPQQRRELARIHAAIKVEAASTTVQPGHPAIGGLTAAAS
jgi:superfamily II DNA/RNA helicase